MALLEVQNVTKSFGGLNAVDNVSFSVERGELIGLIGANGAGKTTLFSVIAGNLKPTSGDIRLDGQSIANLPPFRVSQLGIARTFQIVRPFLAMTVEENVEIAALFGRAQQGGVQARVEAAKPFLGCVIVAGIFGGFTAKRSILWMQALPALLAMLAVIAAHRS